MTDWIQELKRYSRNGNLTGVKEAVSNGADINLSLYIASIYGNFNIVKYVIEKGFDIRIHQSLCASAENGHLDIFKYLLNNGANLNTNDCYPITFATQSGHIEIIEFIMNQDNNQFPDYDYLISTASQRGNFHIVQFLMNKGFSIEGSEDIS